jgi:hypothetical protein
MAIIFSPLLPGETLHSNFSRYAEEVGLQTLHYIYNILSGSIRHDLVNVHRPSIDFRRLAEESEMCWGKTAGEILCEQTFFRYDTLFLGDDERNRRLFEATHDGPKKRWVISGNYRESSFGKYCHICIKEAKRTGVPGYFQLMHQLPYVMVCPIHGTLLSVFDVDFGGLYRYQPFSFNTLNKNGKSGPIKDFGVRYMPGLLDVARRSQVALSGEGECMRDFPYATLLEEGGLKHSRGALKVPETTEALHSYYGAEFCFSSGITNPDVLKATFSRNCKTAAYRQILIQSFLAFRVSGAGEFVPLIRDTNKILQKIVCTGALHRAGDHWLEHHQTRKEGALQLTCSCTRRLQVQFQDNGEVAQTKITGYGKRYSEKFFQLMKRGLSPQAAGRRLGVSEPAARIWATKLHLPQKVSTASPNKMVRSLRQAWTECVQRQPNTTRLTLAYKECRRVYLLLQLHDRDWLKAFNRKYKDVSLVGRKGPERLASTVAAIRLARSSLLALDRPVRVTWVKLLEMSRVRYSYAYKHRAELAPLREELCESVDEFKERTFVH